MKKDVKKTKKTRLSKKQKGFVEDIAKGHNGVDAVLNNYDTTDPRVASVIASQNLNKPNIISAIERIADKIPDELLVEKHLALLNNTDLLGRIDPVSVKAGLDMAYKLKGSYAAEKKEIIIDPINPELKSKIDSAINGILSNN